MKTYLTFLAYFVVQVTLSLSAAVIEIRDWQRADQHVVCFKSVHGEKFPELIGVRQASEVMDAAQKHDAVVIAEDAFTYDGENDEIAKAFEAINQKMLKTIQMCSVAPHKLKPWAESADYFLRQMISKSRKLGIAQRNVECRQTYHALENGVKIAREYVIENLRVTKQKLEKTLEEIKQYMQCDFRAPFFFDYYKTIKKELDKLEPEFFAYLKHCAEIKRHDPISNSKSVNISRTYVKKLVDLKILTDLWQNRDQKIIFLCLGAEHIQIFEPLFDLLKFKTNKVMGSDPRKSFYFGEEAFKMARQINIGQFFQELNLPVSYENRKDRYCRALELLMYGKVDAAEGLKKIGDVYKEKQAISLVCKKRLQGAQVADAEKSKLQLQKDQAQEEGKVLKAKYDKLKGLVQKIEEQEKDIRLKLTQIPA